MRHFNEARDTTALNSSQPPEHSSWLQQLQRHKRDVFLIVLLSILLPSWDMYSDLALTIRLAVEGEVYYALCLLAPQLVNIGMTALLWHRVEPTEHRHWSWILLPLQIWPQVFAGRIIRALLIGSEDWMGLKATMDQKIGTLEPFT